MFSRTLFSVALATISSIAVASEGSQPIDFCLGETQQFGPDGPGNVGFQDTIAGINRVAARAIFYTRTSALRVCYDKDYIHGLEVELAHDANKDPKGVYTLEYVQPGKLIPGNESDTDSVREIMEGSDAGTCEWIDLPEGITIRNIGINYDRFAIRSINFQLSNNQKYEFGYDRNTAEYKYFDGSSISLSGAALVGFRGQVDKLHDHDASAEPHLKHVTLLYNTCNDEELVDMTMGIFPGDDDEDSEVDYETYTIDHSDDMQQTELLASDRTNVTTD